jgi:hypothetical protein
MKSTSKEGMPLHLCMIFKFDGIEQFIEGEGILVYFICFIVDRIGRRFLPFQYKCMIFKFDIIKQVIEFGAILVNFICFMVNGLIEIGSRFLPFYVSDDAREW